MQIRDYLIWPWDSCTPLQVTATYAGLVNGGNLVKPTLIKEEKK